MDLVWMAGRIGQKGEILSKNGMAKHLIGFWVTFTQRDGSGTGMLCSFGGMMGVIDSMMAVFRVGRLYNLSSRRGAAPGADSPNPKPNNQ